MSRRDGPDYRLAYRDREVVRVTGPRVTDTRLSRLRDAGQITPAQCHVLTLFGDLAEHVCRASPTMPMWQAIRCDGARAPCPEGRLTVADRLHTARLVLAASRLVREGECLIALHVEGLTLAAAAQRHRLPRANRDQGWHAAGLVGLRAVADCLMAPALTR